MGETVNRRVGTIMYLFLRSKKRAVNEIGELVLRLLNLKDSVLQFFIFLGCLAMIFAFSVS